MPGEVADQEIRTSCRSKENGGEDGPSDNAVVDGGGGDDDWGVDDRSGGVEAAGDGQESAGPADRPARAAEVVEAAGEAGSGPVPVAPAVAAGTRPRLRRSGTRVLASL